MNFKEIFKLKAGQLALLMLGLLFLSFFIGVYAIIAYYIFIALWIYFLGIELFALLPPGHKLSLFRFKLYFFCMVSSVAIGSYIFLFANISFDDLVKITPLLNIIDLFFILACVLFISKEIILIKHNKTEIHIHDYIGMFISFSLVPFILGILFVQPTIKSIFEKHSQITNDEIEDTTYDQTEEKLINYTPRSYKSDLGEIVIEQELSQPNVGEKIFLNGVPAPTGKYKIGFLQTIIAVDGFVANKLPEPPKEEIAYEPKKEITPSLKKKQYKCDQGELVIEQEYHIPNIGEIAFLNGKHAPTGKYKIGFMQSVYIEDGIVSEKS